MTPEELEDAKKQYRKTEQGIKNTYDKAELLKSLNATLLQAILEHDPSFPATINIDPNDR